MYRGGGGEGGREGGREGRRGFAVSPNTSRSPSTTRVSPGHRPLHFIGNGRVHVHERGLRRHAASTAANEYESRGEFSRQFNSLFWGAR